MLKQLTKQIESVVLQDPGQRGISQWAHNGDLWPAVESLISAKHVLITTGFYITSAHAIETDGPPGALFIAKALVELGKKVTLLIDKHALQIMEAGANALNLSLDIKAFSADEVVDFFQLISEDTTHFIAIERPGRAQDGGYYNHRGNDLSPFVAPFDDLFLEAQAQGIVTIGIGDGGNEMGLGRVAPAVNRALKQGERISCRTKATFCLCAGVSNWAGYAIAALLSCISGRHLLPTIPTLSHVLEAIVAQGAVDGVSGTATPTVDGLSQDWELNILSTLYNLTASILEAASN